MNGLVIGYGNLLRCDDGVGQYVAVQLSCLTSPENTTVLAAHQLTPELVEPISRADLVIFIDANVDGEPGQITMHPIKPTIGVSALAHHVTPETLLDGARKLYGRCPDAIMYSVTGENFELGEELSPSVQAALPGLIKLLLKHCRALYEIDAGVF